MSSENTEKEFPDWDSYYKENKVEKMPWYEKALDLDLENEIKSRKLGNGRFLDLGTGPGTQAIELVKLDFEVTGTDISENAIQQAKQLTSDVNFVADDFLKSNLPSSGFDYVLDRGCFHVFEPSERQKYLEQIKRILSKSRILFLKCFSIKETKYAKDGEGPYRFSKDDITEFFGNDFEVENIKESVYYGTMNPLPKALFAVLKKR